MFFVFLNYFNVITSCEGTNYVCSLETEKLLKVNKIVNKKEYSFLPEKAQKGDKLKTQKDDKFKIQKDDKAIKESTLNKKNSIEKQKDNTYYILQENNKNKESVIKKVKVKQSKIMIPKYKSLFLQFELKSIKMEEKKFFLSFFTFVIPGSVINLHVELFYNKEGERKQQSILKILDDFKHLVDLKFKEYSIKMTF